MQDFQTFTSNQIKIKKNEVEEKRILIHSGNKVWVLWYGPKFKEHNSFGSDSCCSYINNV